jgi:acyl dehydratase
VERALPPVVIRGIEGLEERVGEVLGVSGWLTLTQELVDDFARVTGDDQWIHVDVERARRTSFGGTIVHGYLTLSLAPRLSREIVQFEGFSHALNYGLGRVRFPAPVPVGSRIRMRSRLTRVDPVAGGVQVTVEQAWEREGTDKPVCVAECLSRFYPA